MIAVGAKVQLTESGRAMVNQHLTTYKRPILKDEECVGIFKGGEGVFLEVELPIATYDDDYGDHVWLFNSDEFTVIEEATA